MEECEIRLLEELEQEGQDMAKCSLLLRELEDLTDLVQKTLQEHRRRFDEIDSWLTAIEA